MKFFTHKINLILLSLLFVSKISFAVLLPTNPITITKPSNGSICEALAIGGTAPAWTTLNALVLNENENNNFAKNKTGTIILTAPTGWWFNTAATLTVTGMSADFISFTAVVTNSATITLSWQTANATQSFMDVISIAGVQVQATSVNSADGPIYASGTTGTIPNTFVTGVQGTGLAFADLSLIHVANAGGYQNICITTATMAANNPAPGTGTWTFVSGPVTPVLSSTTLL